FSMDIRDTETVDIGPHLERACVWIEEALRRGEGVLVHCQQGVSRSPSIIIVYLICNHAMSYADAVAFVRCRCACVKPNSGFARALVEWEHMWASRRAQQQGGRPGVRRRFKS
ncbi:protein-tyrosine phosphatase-like protein, partial [Mycena metata]